jgi:hypothetical protein
MRRAALLIALSLPLAARAQELTPAMAAQIEHDQQKAFEEIDKKHGNKLPSELSTDERRDIIHERAAAEEKVFDKRGVDRKDYTKYVTKMPLDDRATMKEATKALEKKDAEEKVKKEADDAAPKDAPRDAKDIPVQRGFNDANPVTLEEKKAGGNVVVEHGLPAEAEADQAAANAGTGLTDSTAETRPEKKEKKKKEK